MRVVIQKVKGASVSVEESQIAQIGRGLIILVGIEEEDEEKDLLWLSKKVAHLRIFEDEEGAMNWSVKKVQGQVLVVSQFTLMASLKKGFRPSYIKAAKPEVSKPIYLRFVELLEKELEAPVQTGQFGAYMEVSLLNDGPVTICIDTKNKE